MSRNSRVLVIKNISREGPGLIGEVMQSSGITFDIVDLDGGETLPRPNAYEALVVLGGPDSANDPTNKMKTELNYVSAWLQTGKPYLGICLGMQILASSSGGKVLKSPVKEVGFLDPEKNRFQIELTREGREDSFFSGLDSPFPVFQLHGETVEPRPDTVLLGQGKFCPCQVIRVGKKAYGIQCHFEITQALLERWCDEDDDLKKMDRQELLGQFQEMEPAYSETGRKLFANFLRILE